MTTMAIHPLLSDRRAGVLLHVTSLPGPFGIGDLGPEADPLHGLDAGGGPLDLADASGRADRPRRLALLEPVELRGGAAARLAGAARRGRPALNARPLAREAIARRAWSGSLRGGASREDGAARGGACEVPRTGAIESCAGARSCPLSRRGRVVAAGLDVVRLASRRPQPRFPRLLPVVLRAAVASAARRGVEAGIVLFGDVPIFTALDSADVHAAPGLFRLDRQGRPEVVTGVPPDSFSKDGQLWGTPHYRWAAHRRDGFRWWRDRIGRALDRFDLVRHRPLHRLRAAYEVPAKARNAQRGAWRRQPGREVLQAMAGPSLGASADRGGSRRGDAGGRSAARRVRAAGMRILQNGFWRDDAFDMPHRCPANCVVYPGTHDNHVATGWWRTLEAQGAKRRFLAYAGASSDPASALVRLSMTSPANLAICQMQDLLAGLPAFDANEPARHRKRELALAGCAERGGCGIGPAAARGGRRERAGGKRQRRVRTRNSGSAAKARHARMSSRSRSG